MTQVVYHLKTKDESVPGNMQFNSELIIQKFVESCVNLDASIFEPYIQEEDIFQDKEKYLFLASLKKLFDKFKKAIGDKVPIDVTNDICTGCSYGKSVKVFTISPSVKNPWMKRFGFVIDTEKGELKDIYQCYQIF